MSSQYEFDETRSAIGSDNLTDDERKAMLDKFKSAGGQVLKERAIGNESDSGGSSGSKRGAGGGSIEVKTPSQIAREKRRQEQERKARALEEKRKAREKLSSPAARFFIKLRCVLAGLTPFSNKVVKPKFMNFLNLEVRQSLVEFNLFGNDLFLRSPSEGRKIISALDKENPLYMETLERAHGTYSQKNFQKLTEYHQANDGMPTPLDTIDDPLRELYKRLYYLYPYQETLKKAVEKAVQVLIESGNLSDEQIADLEQKKKKYLKGVKIVFQNAFSKLFQLICRLDGVDYPPFSGMIEKAVGVDSDEKLGKRKRGETGSLMSTGGSDTGEESEDDSGDESSKGSSEGEAASEEGEEKEEEKQLRPVQQTEEYKYGVALMNKMPPPKLREKHDPKSSWSKLPLNSKPFLNFLYFHEFDKEYSFVLTTNKINIEVDYSSGVKTDHRKQLSDLYDKSRDIIRAFEKFYDAHNELEKLKVKKVSSNYIQQSKAETKAESHVDVEARNLRGLIRNYMDGIAKELGKLISDMKGNRQIITNKDDVLKFSTELEGPKRLNGKKVETAIMEAYCFAIAFKDRVAEGDLGPGHLNLDEEEMKESFGDTFGIFKDDN